MKHLHSNIFKLIFNATGMNVNTYSDLHSNIFKLIFVETKSFPYNCLKFTF